MDPQTVLDNMQTWPLEQQAQFVFDAWDRLLESGWQPQTSETLRAELDRRLAAHRKNPEKACTWDEVKAYVRANP